MKDRALQLLIQSPLYLEREFFLRQLSQYAFIR